MARNVTKKPVASSKPAAKSASAAPPPAAAPTRRVGINMSALIASQAGEVKQPTESGDKVTVLIPKDFTLTLEDHREVKYKAGVDEMPVEHADHWYSKAMGVEIYDPSKKED